MGKSLGESPSPSSAISGLDSHGRVLNTWAKSLIHVGLEVMYERNAHNFSLALGAAESDPMVLQAPAIG